MTFQLLHQGFDTVIARIENARSIRRTREELAILDDFEKACLVLKRESTSTIDFT